MRFMTIAKATKDSEAGVMPDVQLLTDMGKFSEELAKATVQLAAGRLQPSSNGAPVKFSGSKRTVTDGPFAETKELIAGSSSGRVKSRQRLIIKRITGRALIIKRNNLCKISPHACGSIARRGGSEILHFCF